MFLRACLIALTIVMSGCVTTGSNPPPKVEYAK
jgi:hypothetical protein